METRASWRLGHISELCDSGVTLLHLDVFRGNGSHTFAELGHSFCPAEFLFLDPLAATAEANSCHAPFAKNAVSVFPDPLRLWLLDSLENDLPQRSDG